ncbi:SDR family oxidoreductase [bacterium]|nr:SDR family oxidoreductase [bacterium]
MSVPPGSISGPFSDLRVIVAGGTSGIGLACVHLLRSLGARVVAIGKPEGQGASETNAITDSTIHADLTDSTECTVACDRAWSTLGGLDVVVHTVGGSARAAGDGPLDRCTEDGWQAALRLNLDSAFHVVRWGVRKLLDNPRDGEGQRGSIAVVGSVLADSPSPRHFGTIGYAVAKAGLEGLVRNAAATYASEGIRVNLLKPGLLDTPMAARAIRDAQISEFLRAKQPLTAGPVSPEACAQAILSLIDPRNAGLTGAILTLDGGWSVTDPTSDEA